ncbi:adenine deaminase C-terminal domain-containing protein, partial [Rhizobium johnstonii]|uniref:adenine deaminase C-terminal domain-containing protein n=1 Tax=Rhizobium johnstonii TaxID=3019933 RepID=UPI003F9BE8A5
GADLLAWLHQRPDALSLSHLPVAHGLLNGFGLRQGAVASSVGHDSHTIIVAGTNAADMQVALDAIEEKQGGVGVVMDGKVTAMVPLPIAGLLFDKRV